MPTDFCGRGRYLKRYAELSSAIRKPAQSAAGDYAGILPDCQYLRAPTYGPYYPYGLEVSATHTMSLRRGFIDHPLLSFFGGHCFSPLAAAVVTAPPEVSM